MKPTGATKDDDKVLEQAQALTRDWNQKTRVEQIIARHQVWDTSKLPNDEYTASFADVQELRNERERLREALRQVRAASNHRSLEMVGSLVIGLIPLIDAALNEVEG